MSYSELFPVDDKTIELSLTARVISLSYKPAGPLRLSQSPFSLVARYQNKKCGLLVASLTGP